MDTKALEAVALTIRSLSMDAVQKADSGHPGLPMGCAELGALLYGEVMKHNPKDADWIDRDRFVLSAGHGSMLLYSLLYLSGYGLTLDDVKSFRQVGSPCAGHPEYGAAKGIETTTGPLGQGLTNGVGMAIAEQMLAATFNTDTHTIINHNTYVLAGDGCMMEGITSEAASLAGHLGLGKLIVFYDSNKITIDGSTDLAFTEDVEARYRAYNWQTMSGSAYDVENMRSMIDKAKADTSKPTLILLRSVIGKGSPNMAGSHKVHGAPLGEDEVKLTKKNLGIDESAQFFVDPAAESFFKTRAGELESAHSDWLNMVNEWAAENPELKKLWDSYFSEPDLDSVQWPSAQPGDKAATRNVGGDVQNAIARVMPNLIGGSADLAASNKTAMPDYGQFSRDSRDGRTINFGVREHAMGGICNGLALHGGLRPFGATFLVFSDYMRPSIRLAAIMGLPVVYVFTHDSIFVGEDGPTHQPVEHVQSLRAIPGLHVLRPADAEETALAWRMAVERTDGPTMLALTRQKVRVFERPSASWKSDCARGAYVAADCEGEPDVVVVATGSEVELALDAAEKVSGKRVRVVSMISVERFREQDEGFRTSIIPGGARVVVAEAGVSFGWGDVATSRDDVLGIDRFGDSGKAEEVAEHLGLTVDALVALIEK